jgi:hypothetical protein
LIFCGDTTNHFIIVYGAYKLIDPGTKIAALGKSKNNLLKLQPNGLYAGNRSAQNYNLMMGWVGKNY